MIDRWTNTRTNDGQMDNTIPYDRYIAKTRNDDKQLVHETYDTVECQEDVSKIDIQIDKIRLKRNRYANKHQNMNKY